MIKSCFQWLLVLLLFTGCTPSGPPSIETTSAAFATLGERAAVLEKYVTFRRRYEALDFAINFRNNSGGVPPGPTEWDIRLIAQVPATELTNWIPAGAKSISNPDTSWLKDVPTTIDLRGLSEWYEQGRIQIGVDRAQRIIAYRNWAN